MVPSDAARVLAVVLASLVLLMRPLAVCVCVWGGVLLVSEYADVARGGGGDATAGCAGNGGGDGVADGVDGGACVDGNDGVVGHHFASLHEVRVLSDLAVLCSLLWHRVNNMVTRKERRGYSGCCLTRVSF